MTLGNGKGHIFVAMTGGGLHTQLTGAAQQLVEAQSLAPAVAMCGPIFLGVAVYTHAYSSEKYFLALGCLTLI